MTTRRVLLLVGLVLLAGGLLMGFLPRSAGGVSCGSPFAASNQSAYTRDLVNSMYGQRTDVAAQCAAARSSGQVPAIILSVAGAMVLVGSAFVTPSRPEQP